MQVHSISAFVTGRIFQWQRCVIRAIDAPFYSKAGKKFFAVHQKWCSVWRRGCNRILLLIECKKPADNNSSSTHFIIFKKNQVLLDAEKPQSEDRGNQRLEEHW